MGYKTEVFEKNRYKTADKLERILFTRGISAICLVMDYNEKKPPKLNWSNYACVQIGWTPNEQLSMDTITHDNFTTGYRTTKEHLQRASKNPQ